MTGPVTMLHADELDGQERALLAMLADGMVLDAISRRLNLSERTVRRRVRALCDRVGVDTTVQAVVWAAHEGVL
jgi:DNA-binding NarL/FixJ family response regulator